MPDDQRVLSRALEFFKQERELGEATNRQLAEKFLAELTGDELRDLWKEIELDLKLKELFREFCTWGMNENRPMTFEQAYQAAQLGVLRFFELQEKLLTAGTH